jgi:hypothetical protein
MNFFVKYLYILSFVYTSVWQSWSRKESHHFGKIVGAAVTRCGFDGYCSEVVKSQFLLFSLLH